MQYAQCGRYPYFPRVDDDDGGEHPVQHTVLTHQPLQDYNAHRAGLAARSHVRALCYSATGETVGTVGYVRRRSLCPSASRALG